MTALKGCSISSQSELYSLKATKYRNYLKCDVYTGMLLLEPKIIVCVGMISEVSFRKGRLSRESQRCLYPVLTCPVVVLKDWRKAM